MIAHFVRRLRSHDGSIFLAIDGHLREPTLPENDHGTAFMRVQLMSSAAAHKSERTRAAHNLNGA